MKIKSFYTTSPIFEGGRFDDDKPVCVFAAPAVFLHMMRCLLDGESDDTPIDETKERTFVSRVNFELDGEEIELCGILCADQSFFVAVKDGEHFSAERTLEVIAKLRSMKRDDRNSYNFFNKYVANENYLSECDYNIENFKRFIEIAREETEKGDVRPIYVFNFFERLDVATDIAPFIDLLASLGKQVFIGIGNYPLERFEKCMKVQIV
jgi:hypothetical protein